MTPEQRDTAIAWLQDEIRSLRLAPTINGCDMKPEWEDMLEIMETCLEAVKACPLAHIDREAFGCQFCNGKFCGNCLYDALPVQIEPCRSCESHSKWETDYRFCPHCGRPLTPEAWAELEKRLRGQYHPEVHSASVSNPKSSEKYQVRISSLKGPDGLQIYIGFKCGKMEKDISFMFDKADPPLDDICKFLSQQLTELVQGL